MTGLLIVMAVTLLIIWYREIGTPKTLRPRLVRISWSRRHHLR
jgi:hypothetical protein